MSTTPPYSNPPAPATPPASMVDHDALPAGTRFGEFEILRVLGVGGFGIVYLAMDHSLQRHVALKEYMPAALASRGQGPQITVRSGSFAETYAIGLRSFVNEARLLARFDHPSLVKVYRFWEDNATAYMVMPYLQGNTLREARRAMTEPPGEAWIRSVLDPLLGALEQLHREGVFHRDIAPDNIVLPPNGPPVLLDFGAARHVISDRTQSLTAILKPSYAPIEQYAEMTQLRQGPWTDLYALGAVMHFVLTGAPPAPATARAVQDDAQALEDRNIPGVSARFLAAISWMLAVRPQARPQNVETLRAALDGRIGIPMNARAEPATPPAAAPGSAAFEPTIRVDALASMPAPASTAHQPTVRVPPPSASVTAPVMRGIAAAPPLAPVLQTLPPAPAQAPAPAPAIQPTPPLAASASPWQSAAGAAADSGKSSSKGAKGGLVLAALGVAAVLAGVAFWQFGGQRPAAGAGGSAAGLGAAVVSNPAVTPAAAPAVLAAPVSQVVSAAAAVSPPSQAAASSTALAVPAVLAKDAAASASAAAASRAVVRAKPAAKPAAVRSEPPAVPTMARVEPRQPEAVAVPPVADNSQRPAPQPSAEPGSVAAPALAEGPATAREVCGKRVFIALANCMERECLRPRFRDHSDCVKVMQMKGQRDQR